MPGWCISTQQLQLEDEAAGQDTSPEPSLELDGLSRAVFSRPGVELAITSWFAHQIIVRVARVLSVSIFTADIKAVNSGKKTAFAVSKQVNSNYAFKTSHHDYCSIFSLVKNGAATSRSSS